MEDDLNFFLNGRQPQFKKNGRRPQFFLNGRQPQFKKNGRRPQFFLNGLFQINDDL